MNRFDTVSRLLSAEFPEVVDAYGVINIENRSFSGYQCLAGANLAGARMARCILEGANLEEANLAGACLDLANLRNANLSGADLAWANLSGANLSGASLCRACLYWANLAGANLTGANLTGANWDRSDLGGASLDGAIAIGIRGQPQRNTSGLLFPKENLIFVDHSEVFLPAWDGFV